MFEKYDIPPLQKIAHHVEQAQSMEILSYTIFTIFYLIVRTKVGQSSVLDMWNIRDQDERHTSSPVHIYVGSDSLKGRRVKRLIYMR